jgi:hypothetical protein
MASFSVVETVPKPAFYNLPKLHEEAQAAFGGRFVDFNEVGDNVCVYLTTGMVGDGATLAGVVAAHNPATQTAGQTKQANAALATDEILAEIDNMLSVAQTAYDGWAGLTAGQKDTAQKQTVLAIIRILKLIKWRLL